MEYTPVTAYRYTYAFPASQRKEPFVIIAFAPCNFDCLPGSSNTLPTVETVTLALDAGYHMVIDGMTGRPWPRFADGRPIAECHAISLSEWSEWHEKANRDAEESADAASDARTMPAIAPTSLHEEDWWNDIAE